MKNKSRVSILLLSTMACSGLTLLALIVLLVLLVNEKYMVAGFVCVIVGLLSTLAMYCRNRANLALKDLGLE